MIKNNKSSQWTTSNNNINYDTYNVGIGTYNPISKLHIFDDTTNSTALTIHNNFNSTIIITPSSGYITTTITEGTPSTKYQIDTFTFNQGNLIAYYKFNNSINLGVDSNPSSTKYNLTPTIVGGTGGYNTTTVIEGGSLQATNDGDLLEGDFPLKSIYDNSTTGISISCWFYKKSGTTYDNVYYTTLFRFYNPSNNQELHFTLGHLNNIHYLNYAFSYMSGGETYAGGFGSNQTLDTWYHLVFVFTKSGHVKVYYNGNLLTTTPITYGGSAYPLPQCPNTTKLRIFNPYG
jgi:hypothetical protein